LSINALFQAKNTFFHPLKFHGKNEKKKIFVQTSSHKMTEIRTFLHSIEKSFGEIEVEESVFLINIFSNRYLHFK
jgi:hypothetical protein